MPLQFPLCVFGDDETRATRQEHVTAPALELVMKSADNWRMRICLVGFLYHFAALRTLHGDMMSAEKGRSATGRPCRARRL